MKSISVLTAMQPTVIFVAPTTTISVTSAKVNMFYQRRESAKILQNAVLLDADCATSMIQLFVSNVWISMRL